MEDCTIMAFEIDISRNDVSGEIDTAAIIAAVEHGLQVEGVAAAVLSITVVDNATMQRLNREHLQHDYPTDVISFQLDWMCADATLEVRSQLSNGRSRNASVEGEIVVSGEYAAEMAPRCGWSQQNELTLYAIHGMLHICGYDDLTNDEKELMRSRERAILQGLGLTPKYPGDIGVDDDEPPPASVQIEGA